MKFRFKLLCDRLKLGVECPIVPVERHDNQYAMTLTFEEEAQSEQAAVLATCRTLEEAGVQVRFIEVYEVDPHPSLNDYDYLVTAVYETACEAAEESLERRMDAIDHETSVAVKVTMALYRPEDYFEVFDE